MVSADGEKVCPNCECTDFDIDVKVSDVVEVKDQFSGIGEREGRKIGFRESERDGRITSADQTDDGTFTFSIQGTSPQGEQDTLHTCKLLIAAMNIAGGDWSYPKSGEGVDDCVVTNKSSPNRKLTIQVTRAIPDQNLWEQLSHHESYSEINISCDQLVNHLLEAIMKKANDREIPVSSRQGLTLALDATRLPVLGFDDVIQEFRSQYGGWAHSLGFESVWLVGPQPPLVWRLDLTDPDQ